MIDDATVLETEPDLETEESELDFMARIQREAKEAEVTGDEGSEASAEEAERGAGKPSSDLDAPEVETADAVSYERSERSGRARRPPKGCDGVQLGWQGR